MNIIFAGTPELSVPILEALINSHHTITAVYTQPDRPSGRGQKLQSSPVKLFAEKNNIPVYQPEKLTEFPHENIDVVIVAVYGLMIPEFILQKPKYGCINVHLSLLPRWRGAAPIHRAILSGDKETGITIMQMAKGLDTGDILAQQSCPILSTDNIKNLENKLAPLGADLLLKTLDKLHAIKPIPQDNNLATYAHKINKSESEINWNLSAEEINRIIRAFCPAYSHLDNLLIKIGSAVIIEKNTDADPGSILNSNSQGIDVSTGKNILRILTLQLPGGKMLSVRDILNSKAKLFEVGKRFSVSLK